MRTNRTTANVRSTKTNVRRVSVSPFIQLMNVPYETADGKSGSSIHALDLAGNVWKYQHGERAWVQFPTDRVQSIG